MGSQTFDLQDATAPEPSGNDTLLILGASSDMAQALARNYAARGWVIWLAGRHPTALEEIAEDLRLRNRTDVQVFALDAEDLASHDAFMDGLPRLPDVVACYIGVLGDQVEACRSADARHRLYTTNFTGPANLLSLLANGMEARGRGTLIGVSSVAGERGRKSNYHYGAAKAGFTAFLSGLRNRLHPAGVHVMTVKPGFVATRMTQGMDLPGPLTATAAKTAKAIARGHARRRNVVYVLWIWRYVMAIIKAIPEPLFKRLSL